MILTLIEFVNRFIGSNLERAKKIKTPFQNNKSDKNKNFRHTVKIYTKKTINDTSHFVFIIEK